MRQLCFLLTLLAFPTLWAGWTSGGGELLRTAINPWFIQNTKVVHYCVLADEKNFG